MSPRDIADILDPDPLGRLKDGLSGLPGISDFNTTTDVVASCGSNPGGAGCGRDAVRATQMIANLALGARGTRPGCFVEGTSVLTPDGEVAIEDVKVGDFVLTRDAETNAWSWQQVTRTFVHRVPGVLALTMVDDEGNATTLMVTPEHPFMSVSGAFVEAGDLQAADEVVTVRGKARIFESTWLPGDITVFNFEVDETHTYFVGELGAWVHNACGDPIKRLHGDGTLKPSILDRFRKQSTEQIVKDLKTPGADQLKLRPDGTVLDGNHRVKVLEERGFDTSTLWDGAEVIPKSGGFWDD